jgi:hypothetical protein
MNAAGLALVIAGIWVVAQVTAGDALQRLGIVASTAPAAPANVDPKSGVPNQNPSLPYLYAPGGGIL